MTNQQAPTVDTVAIVEVRLLLRIPDDAALYETHEAKTQDAGQIKQAIAEEAVSWWEPLGAELLATDVQVLAIR